MEPVHVADSSVPAPVQHVYKCKVYVQYYKSGTITVIILLVTNLMYAMPLYLS